MSKYIIKNCPAFQKVGVRGSNGKITVLEEVENYCLKEVNSCVACTDCLLKQVVNKCKNEVICDDCELQGTNKCDARMCTNFYLNDFAQDILQLFEIEECKE